MYTWLCKKKTKQKKTRANFISNQKFKNPLLYLHNVDA